MAMSLEQLSCKVLEMPTRNRAILAKRLLDSLDSAQEQPEKNELLWAQEAERRYKEIKEGKTVTRPASVVMRAARERFKR